MSEVGEHEQRLIPEEYLRALAVLNVVEPFDIGGVVLIEQVIAERHDFGELLGIVVQLQSGSGREHRCIACGYRPVVHTAVKALDYSEAVVFVVFSVIVKVLGDALCQRAESFERPCAVIDLLIEVADLVVLRDLCVEEADLR